MYCRAQFVELTSHIEELNELNAQVLAVSVDDLRAASYIVESLGVPFPILYNPDADVVREYGVYNLLRDGLAAPSTFMIDQEGIIRWKYIGRGIDDRPSSRELLDQLRRVASSG